jgi:integrase/recombinase XerD
MFLYHFTDSAGRGRTFATQRARLSAVRSFLRALVQTEVLPYDPSSTLSFPKRGRTLPRVILNPREMKKLLAAPDRTTPLGCRDRAMLEVLYSAGLRNAELRALRLGDIDMSRGVAHIRQGKNGRDRVVPIGAIALGALRRYFRESRPRLVGREDEQAVFLASITRHRLLPKTLTYLVRKYSAAAGFGERVTPHLLRHTCMTHLLQGGASSEDVRAILGHVSVGTTHIYTHVTIEDVVAAHARHHPREKLRVA